MPTPWSEGDKAQVTIDASEVIDILCFALASLLQAQVGREKVGREKMLEMYEATIDLLKHYMLESYFGREHRCDEDKD